MGVDLRFLPYEADRDNFAFSHSILSCDRDRDLWDLIAPIEKAIGVPVIDNFSSFLGRNGEGEHAYGKTTDTPYGTKLKWVPAEALLSIALPDDLSARNKAIWAYLAQLPGSTKVALYWH